MDGFTQGYKYQPVPRRLVGQNQIPPSLFPAYTNSNNPVPEAGFFGKYGKIRTGLQTYLWLCRLPVGPQGGQDQTHLE